MCLPPGAMDWSVIEAFPGQTHLLIDEKFPSIMLREKNPSESNGVARTRKKLRISKGDYWITQ